MNTEILSETGLFTSTSAEHICSLAKEKMKSYEDYINSVSFINSSVGLVSNTPVPLNKGITPGQCEELLPMIEAYSKYRAIITYLKEVIKYKKELLIKVQNLTDEEYAEISGKQVPVRPAKIKSLIYEDYIKSLPIKELCEYREAESNATHYGLAIEPSKRIALARNEAKSKLNSPSEVVGSGRDMTIYSYCLSVPMETIDTAFFDIKNVHREVQARFNGLTHKYETYVEDYNLKQIQKEQEAYAQYYRECEKFFLDKEEYIKSEKMRISQLKIELPNHLRSTYEELNILGKQ